MTVGHLIPRSAIDMLSRTEPQATDILYIAQVIDMLYSAHVTGTWSGIQHFVRAEYRAHVQYHICARVIRSTYDCRYPMTCELELSLLGLAGCVYHRFVPHQDAYVL